MKLHKEFDVEVLAGGDTTSAGLHVPPRYNGIEFTTQLVVGSSPYDVEIQALPAYPGPTEIFNGPSTLSLAAETDWISLTSELAIDPDHDFTTQVGSYGYYRFIISSAGNVTIRVYVVGIA